MRPVCTREQTLLLPPEDFEEALHLGIDNRPQADPLNGYKWGVSQTDQLIQRQQTDKGQHRYQTMMDVQGISTTNEPTHPGA